MGEINIVEDCLEFTTLTYGIGECEFGQFFLVFNQNDIICYCAFIDSKNISLELENLQKIWPKAIIIENNAIASRKIAKIFDKENTKPLDIMLTGTPFQVKVWKEVDNLHYLFHPRSTQHLLPHMMLLKKQKTIKFFILPETNIRKGTTSTYQDIADAIGNPKAVRAVGSAVGKNRLAYLIPCHRVITKNSGLGKFKWGNSQKEKLLFSENATHQFHHQ